MMEARTSDFCFSAVVHVPPYAQNKQNVFKSFYYLKKVINALQMNRAFLLAHCSAPNTKEAFWVEDVPAGD